MAQLTEAGILERGATYVDINMVKQENYLKSQGEDTSAMTEQEIREANTGSQVFLKIHTKILDAIEDIDIDIVI